MGTNVGEAEVEIVSTMIEFGVKMPVSLIIRKHTYYGGEVVYDVRESHGVFTGKEEDDVANIGRRVYAQAIGVINQFEENEKK